MDAARLLGTIELLDGEWTKGTVEYLGALIQALIVSRDNPGQDHSGNVASARETLFAHLRAAPSNSQPPSVHRTINHIGATQFAGTTALQHLQEVLAEKLISAAGTVVALEAYQSELVSLRKSLTQIRKGFEAIDIVAPALRQDECEVGVLIPDSMTKAHLGSISQHLGIWNSTIRGFAELAGDTEREIVVRAVTDGSVGLYVSVGLNTARSLGETIDAVLGWYQRITRLRSLREQMIEAGGSTESIETAKSHEKHLLGTQIDELVASIIDRAPPSITKDRKQELKNQLTIHIQHIARFVDEGGDIEITAPKPEALEKTPAEPTEPPDAAKKAELEATKKRIVLQEQRNRDLELISKQGASLAVLPPRKSPILQLDYPKHTGAESDAPDKGPKKKS